MKGFQVSDEATKLFISVGKDCAFIIGKMVGAPWDGGPLIIKPIYTLYSGHLYVFIG